MLMNSMFGESLFDEFFDNFAWPSRRIVKTPAQAAPLMRTDVKENETGYELNIELPGYKKEDVQAELKDGNLTIRAATNMENNEKDQNGKYVRRERFYGNCSRSFYVGEAVQQEDIKARFENGIL